jgi:hypothetical protein
MLQNAALAWTVGTVVCSVVIFLYERERRSKEKEIANLRSMVTTGFLLQIDSDQRNATEIKKLEEKNQQLQAIIRYVKLLHNSLVIECSFIAGALAKAQFLKSHYQSKSRTLEDEKDLREAGEKRMAALSELLRSLGKGLEGA